MADPSKKLTVIKTDQMKRYEDALDVAKNALEEVKGDKNIRSVIFCVERPGGNISTFFSASIDTLTLGSRLMFMGLARMGYKTHKE